MLYFFFPDRLQDAERFPVEGVHGPKERRLLVQRLPGVRAESGGDVERLSLDEGIGSGIPCRVAPRFKRRPEPSGGKGGRVRLALDQFFSRKIQNDAAERGALDETVVFFRGDPCQRLEPVCEVGRAF